MLISILIAAVIAVSFNLFFFHPIGIFGIFFLLSIFLSYAIAVYYQRLPKITIFGLAGCYLLFWWLSSIRSLSLLQFLFSSAGAGILLFTVYLGAAGKSFVDSLSELIFMPFWVIIGYFVSYLAKIPSLVSKVIGIRSAKGKIIPPNVMLIVLGFVIAVPILAVLVGLLSSGDPIFAKLINDVIKKITITIFIERAIYTSLIFLFIVPWAVMRIESKSAQFVSSNDRYSLGIPVAVVQILTGLVLALFLIVAYPYVFAKVAEETSLIKFGVATYSEYVKKGFTEFIFVSMVMYIVLWMGVLARKSKDKFSSKILPIIQTVVTIIFVIFLISIFRRIMLYWQFHGLTLSRFYGGVFLSWIAFLTGMVTIRHFIKMKYVLAEVVGTGILLVFLGFFNSEAYIVAHHPPTVNKQTDYVYLSRLSPDGYRGWQEALSYSKQSLDLFAKKPGILNSEDRRQIAEVGEILGAITEHYHELTTKYGTDADKSLYLLDIAAVETNRFSDSRRLFSAYANPKTRTPELYQYLGGLTGMYESPIGTAFLDQIQVALSKQEKLSAQVGSTSPDIAAMQKVFAFRPQYSYIIRQFDALCPAYVDSNRDPIINGYTCAPSFYSVANTQRSLLTEKNPVTSLLTWHYTGTHVYAQLKRDLPLSALLSLQDQYIALWKRIIAQPKEEHGFTSNIRYSSSGL
jgi:hypothetical protein